jgi:hypothetical protein
MCAPPIVERLSTPSRRPELHGTDRQRTPERRGATGAGPLTTVGGIHHPASLQPAGLEDCSRSEANLGKLRRNPASDGPVPVLFRRCSRATAEQIVSGRKYMSKNFGNKCRI